MKFSIRSFFSKYEKIRSFLWIWSHLLKKSLMKSFNFCAVLIAALRYQDRANVYGEYNDSKNLTFQNNKLQWLWASFSTRQSFFVLYTKGASSKFSQVSYQN